MQSYKIFLKLYFYQCLFLLVQFKEMGYLSQAMVNYLALLGWGDGTENEFYTIDELGQYSVICILLSFSSHLD